MLSKKRESEADRTSLSVVP